MQEYKGRGEEAKSFASRSFKLLFDSPPLYHHDNSSDNKLNIIEHM